MTLSVSALQRSRTPISDVDYYPLVFYPRPADRDRPDVFHDHLSLRSSRARTIFCCISSRRYRNFRDENRNNNIGFRVVVAQHSLCGVTSLGPESRILQTAGACLKGVQTDRPGLPLEGGGPKNARLPLVARSPRCFKSRVSAMGGRSRVLFAERYQSGCRASVFLLAIMNREACKPLWHSSGMTCPFESPEKCVTNIPLS
jgi:hypothetical protein